MTTKQTTLSGDEPIPRQCEQEGPCQSPAKYEIEVFAYDGGGWLYVTRAACATCTDEFLETPDTSSDDVRRLKPSERWTDSGGTSDR